MKSPSYKAKKNLVFIIIPLILVVVVVIIFLIFRANSNKDQDATINYSPATQIEKQESEDKKEEIVKDNKNDIASANNQPQNQQSVKQVIPVITNASSGSINGFVGGIFEDGGVCKATFTNGTSSLSKSSEGFKNVSTTQCTPIIMDKGLLSPGQWSVTLSYASNTANGISTTKTFKVN